MSTPCESPDPLLSIIVSRQDHPEPIPLETAAATPHTRRGSGGDRDPAAGAGEWTGLMAMFEGRVDPGGIGILHRRIARDSLRSVCVAAAAGRHSWPMDDPATDLLSRVRSGSEGALHEFFRQHEQRLLRMIEDPKTLTPAQWQQRYAAEVEERRNYVLARILGQIAG